MKLLHVSLWRQQFTMLHVSSPSKECQAILLPLKRFSIFHSGCHGELNGGPCSRSATSLKEIQSLLHHHEFTNSMSASSSFPMKPTGSYQVHEAAPPHLLMAGRSKNFTSALKPINVYFIIIKLLLHV
ncbi:hypothetical protein Dimus_022700 [Dionaea muscipula]